MRNIIFTSLIAGMIPLMAHADGPDVGCYDRTYSPEHLAANPAQVVAKMRLLIYVEPTYGETMAAMEVQMANQGHVAKTDVAGQTLRQGLICYTGASGDICAVECDGGSMVVTRQDKSGLTFRTSYLSVGETDSCAGVSDLAEVQGQEVSYRLEAAPMSVCDRLR